MTIPSATAADDEDDGVVPIRVMFYTYLQLYKIPHTDIMINIKKGMSAGHVCN